MNDMRLSQILKSAEENFGIYEILEDEEFDSIGLVASQVDLKLCTFIENENYISDIGTNITMIITKPNIAKKIKNKGICISNEPRVSYFKLHNYLTGVETYTGTEKFETQIGENSIISPLACIANENVKIGRNVIIEEFVSIKQNTIIGDNTIIRSGVVIGGEGFEYKRLKGEEILSVKHVGWIQIGDSVEIKYNSCIDKAIYPWDKTIIADNCRISNLVQISHGVKLGKGVFVTAGSVISGRTEIGDDTWVGVGATISNGLIIGKNSRVNIGAVATKSLEQDSSVTGNFAIDHNKFIEFIKSIR